MSRTRYSLPKDMSKFRTCMACGCKVFVLDHNPFRFSGHYECRHDPQNPLNLGKSEDFPPEYRKWGLVPKPEICPKEACHAKLS